MCKSALKYYVGGMEKEKSMAEARVTSPERRMLRDIFLIIIVVVVISYYRSVMINNY